MTSINCPLFNPTAPQKGEAIVDWLNQLQVEMDSYGAKTKNKRCYDELKRYCAHLYTLYSKEVYKGVVKREIDVYYNTINNNKRLITLNEDSDTPSYPEICKNPSTLNKDLQKLCSSLWVATNPILYNSMQDMINNLNTDLASSSTSDTQTKSNIQQFINIFQWYLIFFSGGTSEMLKHVYADFCTQIVKGTCSNPDTDLCSCSGGETLNYYLTDPKFSFEKMKVTLQGGMNTLITKNNIKIGTFVTLSPPSCNELNWPNPDDLPGIQDIFLYNTWFDDLPDLYLLIPTKITCTSDSCTGCTPNSQGYCVMNSSLDTSVQKISTMSLDETSTITAFSIFGDYSSLKTIDLSKTKITDFTADLPNQTSLASLQMPKNSITSFTLIGTSREIDPIGISNLEDCTLLETINLSGTQITDFTADLSGLTNLKNLYMPETLTKFSPLNWPNTKKVHVDLSNVKNALAPPSSSPPINPSFICFILGASGVQANVYYTGNTC